MSVPQGLSHMAILGLEASLNDFLLKLNFFDFWHKYWFYLFNLKWDSNLIIPFFVFDQKMSFVLEKARFFNCSRIVI